MSPEAEKRQKPRREPFSTQPNFTLKCQTTQMSVKLVDVSEIGVSVELSTLLAPGLLVDIAGEIEDVRGRRQIKRRCRVCRCARMENGQYLAGLAFEPIAEESAQNAAAKGNGAADHYEILELSRNASSDTIQRVFRLIAQRYHPDNQETGNAELFRQLVEAHQVLSDPERRAAYDAQLATQTKSRFKIFETWESSRGVEAEKRKRQGILSLLYGKRLTDPHQPSMAIRDFEEMLGCPREHLEFSLWFLKENKWLTRSDNNKFEITWQGVAAVEAQGTDPLQPARPQLPAPESE